MCRRYAWVFAVMALVGPIIGFATSAVVTYVMPKKYESETVIEVKPLPYAIPGGLRMTVPCCGVEYDIFKSRKLLTKVVDNLQMITRWNVDKETAVQILKGIVHTENIRGTDLISIRVRHTDKVDARDIANAVAHAYKDYRIELIIRDAEARLHELRKAVRDQEDKVEERRKLLATIIRVKGIIIPEGGAPGDVKVLQPENPAPDTDKTRPAESERDAAIRRALDTQDYIDAKRDFETDQGLLQQLKLKQVNDELESKIPYQSIEIHDEAMIPFSPASPNVTLNLILGTTGGLLLSPLLSLLVIGVMKLFATPVAAR